MDRTFFVLHSSLKQIHLFAVLVADHANVNHHPLTQPCPIFPYSQDPLWVPEIDWLPNSVTLSVRLTQPSMNDWFSLFSIDVTLPFCLCLTVLADIVLVILTVHPLAR